jgi:glutathione S-transferase
VPFDNGHHLQAYFERLIARPAAKRALQEAKPWFKYYPFSEAIPARFTADD